MKLKLSRNIPVFCLHDVSINPIDKWTISANQFEKFLRYLKKHDYRTIHASKVTENNYTTKTVSITFDDGLSGLHKYALPLLVKYGFTATVFISTAYMNQMFDGDSESLTDAQIGELIEGGIEIGSHGHIHQNMRELSNKEQQLQLKQSKEILEARFKVNVNTFAYPYGQYDQRLISSVIDSGYRSAFSVFRGVRRLSHATFVYDRLEISSSWHPFVHVEYWLKTSGWYLF
jgi:peptidoglycan/xylan/chitin deacetylase (PgdA/CDA1 family)